MLLLLLPDPGTITPWYEQVQQHVRRLLHRTTAAS
jgi:hypothetical protein